MNNISRKLLLLICLFPAILPAQNAPISTVATIASSGSADTVPVTAIHFTNIRSCNLKLLYDPAVVSVTSLTAGPLLGGVFQPDLTVPGIIYLGWFTYPGLTLPDNSVIFKIAVTKVTACPSAITWSDNGISCIWYDGNLVVLNDLPTATYYIDGSVAFPDPVTADFTVSNTTPPKNTTVQLTDLSTGCPTGWAWSFDRSSVVYVNSTSSTSQNPQVQFTDGGLYTVTLVAHNALYNDTKVRTAYIRAGIAGLWDGTTSSDWTIFTNWDNWLVPGSAIDVVISSPATNWPQFTGNLVLGSDCKSITMNGTAQAVITGDFTINTGHSLTFTGSGTLKVGGNWSDSGSFTTGTGSVEFFGPTPSSILAPANETFYNLIENKSTGVTLTIPYSVTVKGDCTLK